eukprot:1699391-Prymnesium_polylepis.2
MSFEARRGEWQRRMPSAQIWYSARRVEHGQLAHRLPDEAQVVEASARRGRHSVLPLSVVRVVLQTKRVVVQNAALARRQGRDDGGG